MDYNQLRMDGGGFRVSLQEAVRIEDEEQNDGGGEHRPNSNSPSSKYVDWSVHTIDYDSFKSKLRQYSKRRARIRRKLAASSDDSLDAAELESILGPPTTDVTRADVAALMLPLSRAQSTPASTFQYEETELVSNRQQRRPDRSSRGTHTRNVTYDADTMGAVLEEDKEEQQASQGNGDDDNDNGGHDISYITMQADDSNYHTLPDNFSSSANTPYPSNRQRNTQNTQPSSTYRNFFSFSGRNRLKRREIMRHVSNWERNDLIVFLSQELDKVSMFYLAQWSKLTHQFMALTKGGYTAAASANRGFAKQRRGQGGANKNVSIESDSDGKDDDEIVLNPTSNTTNEQEADFNATILPWITMGKEILELQAFCAMNAVALRQILIRYDAFARAYEGTPMMQYYMKLIKSSKRECRKILQHEEVIALGDSYLEYLQQEQEVQQETPAAPSNNSQSQQYYSYIATQFQHEQAEIQAVVASSEHAEATATLGHAPLQDTLLDTLRYYFLLGMLEDRLGYEPSYLTTRGRSLTPEMRQLASWRRLSKERWSLVSQGRIIHMGATTTPPLLGCLGATPAVLAESSVSSDGKQQLRAATPVSEHSVAQLSHTSSNKTPTIEEPTISKQQKFNLFMALTAGFFYCLNYYIVEPSSTMYVNALGAQDAMSATLIGMVRVY